MNFTDIFIRKPVLATTVAGFITQPLESAIAQA